MTCVTLTPIKHPNLCEVTKKKLACGKYKCNFSDFFLNGDFLRYFSDFRHEELAELVKFMAMEITS